MSPSILKDKCIEGFSGLEGKTHSAYNRFEDVTMHININTQFILRFIDNNKTIENHWWLHNDPPSYQG